ncbi:TIR domain-containing protein [Patescibacteria group bacterium]|nr:TIR domain-containing protein [Patescibacteria group bacterium]MBU1935002.1 TIR domain-containing protein [Patescibacteria group bacterium]
MDDLHAKTLLCEQAKSDKFDLEFVNYSVNEPFDEKWKTNCKERINQTSVTICLFGENTYKREAVLWELNTAYSLDKKVFGVRIYKDENHIVPAPLRENGASILKWNISDIVAELNKL